VQSLTPLSAASAAVRGRKRAVRMAFSKRSTMPAKQASSDAPFRGEWEDDEGAVITVKDGEMTGPDGSKLALTIRSPTSCSFKMGHRSEEGTFVEEEFVGTLENGQLVWSDGCVWIRRKGQEPEPRATSPITPTPAPVTPAKAVEEPIQPNSVAKVAQAHQDDAEQARRKAALERARARAAEKGTVEDGKKDEEARRLIEAEKQRKMAALERARARAAAQGDDDDDAEMPPLQQNLQQQCDSRTFEEKKAAALARARAKAAGEAAQEATQEAPAAAKPKLEGGLDRARRIFEEEKARKAAALERARAKAAEQSAASTSLEEDKAKSMSGLEKARQAFEAEKARKAAALEKARNKVASVAKTNAAGRDASDLPDLLRSAKDKPSESQERARQAFDAEKARKAAALERVRAAANAGGTSGQRSMNAGDLGARGMPQFGSNRFARGGKFGGTPMRQSENRTYRSFGNVETVDANEDEGLNPGIIVQIMGVKAKPELNGKVGMVIDFDKKKERWQVRVDGASDMLFREENLYPVTPDEYEELLAQAKQQDGCEEDSEDDRGKLDADIPTKASGEAMRLAKDQESEIAIEPGAEGNAFDVCMADHADGNQCSKLIADLLKERGVCLVEANANHDLLSQAFDEAEKLYEDRDFGPPLKIHDEDSRLEAQFWNSNLFQDEKEVVWVREGEAKSEKMQALMEIQGDMMDFAEGLGDSLEQRARIKFSHLWGTMLSCYTGDRQYSLHIDNPRSASQNGFPDNGLRLTMQYWINPTWNPAENYNGGGLDVYLTDPRYTPASAAAARSAKKIRIAPHADTMCVFLSDRMAHQVIPTKGKDKWFCLTLWGFEEEVMNECIGKIAAMQDAADDQLESDDEY